MRHMASSEILASRANAVLDKIRPKVDPQTQTGRFSMSKVKITVDHSQDSDWRGWVEGTLVQLLKDLGLVRLITTGGAGETWWVDFDRQVTAQDVAEWRQQQTLRARMSISGDVKSLALRIVELENEIKRRDRVIRRLNRELRETNLRVANEIAVAVQDCLRQFRLKQKVG